MALPRRHHQTASGLIERLVTIKAIHVPRPLIMADGSNALSGQVPCRVVQGWLPAGFSYTQSRHHQRRQQRSAAGLAPDQLCCPRQHCRGQIKQRRAGQSAGLITKRALQPRWAADGCVGDDDRCQFVLKGDAEGFFEPLVIKIRAIFSTSGRTAPPLPCPPPLPQERASAHHAVAGRAGRGC